MRSFTERKHKKETNLGAEEYNNWTQEFTRELQRQTVLNRRRNQWTQKQNIWNYIVREQKGKKNKKEWRQDLWDPIKRNNVCITEIPEGEEKEKGAESLFEEIMAKNFRN